MRNWKRERINLLEIMDRSKTPYSNIVFDPAVIPEYYIKRQQAHDGTLFFTLDAIEAIADLLIHSNSHFIPTAPYWPDVDHINYTIGWMQLITVFGTVKLPAGTYPGQRERIILPVKCHYVLKDLD